MGNEPSRGQVFAYSLRTRTLIFLFLLILLSVSGAILMSLSEEKTSATSARIRENLVPAWRLVDQAGTELDLQLQELKLLTASSDSAAQKNDQMSGLNLARLRLSPSVRALMTLPSGPLLPQALLPLFDPWIEAAARYQAKVTELRSLSEAIPPLQDLRGRTRLLSRGIDRELSVELLNATKTEHENLLLWSSTLWLGILSALVFVFLVWRWMQPLDQVRTWLERSSSDPRAHILSALPPRSVLGTGLFSPPAEVQSLIEALRIHLRRFREQATELEARSRSTEESEKAMGTLFSGLNHLMRHNEELVKELIKKEKLASMSEMAAELAHEIRNPLNSMNLKLELLREDLSETQRAQLDKVLVEIDRLDALTESHLRTTRSVLTGFTTFPLVTEEFTDIAKAASEAIETLKPEFRHIPIVFDVRSAGELTALLPENVLKAALINLLKNARESGTSSIVVEISGGRESWSLSVCDRGCGFPAHLLDHPFRAFQTTKDSGSGLGLSTAQKMLEAYNARIMIESPCPPYSTRVSIRGGSKAEWETTTGRALDSHS